MLGSFLVVFFACNFIGQLHSIPVKLQENKNEKLQIDWIGPIGSCDTEPNLNTCISKFVKEIKPLVLERLEDLGFPNLDPIKIATVEYEKSQGSFNLNVINKNMILSGFPNYNSAKITIDTNENTIRFFYENPVIRVDSNYKLGGKLFFYPLKGTGPMFIEFSGFKTEYKMPFYKTKNEKGENIIQVKETIIENMSFKDLNASIRGLFDGNPLLNAVVNYFANNYGKEIYEVFKQDIDNSIQKTVTNTFVNPFLSKMPELSECIPDNTK